MNLARLALVAFAALCLVTATHNPAVAQRAAEAAIEIPNRSPGRLACKNMKALEDAIAALPTAQSAERNSEELKGEDCVWMAGNGLLPVSGPIGWRYSGDYLFLVTIVNFAHGNGLLHPAVIADRRKWRLEDECSKLDLFADAKILVTGEKHQYFGQRRKGFDPFCANLVDRVAEADALNQPQQYLSENWQTRPYWRNMIACQDLGGLAQSLDRMVNEQQVNNSDNATFTMKNGCIFRAVDEIVASRFLGLYTTTPVSGNGPQFVVEIHEVVHINRRTGVLTTALMPTTPVRARMLRLPSECTSPMAVPVRGRKVVYLAGAEPGNIEAAVVDAPGGRKVAYSDLPEVIGIQSCAKQDLVFERR